MKACREFTDGQRLVKNQDQQVSWPPATGNNAIQNSQLHLPSSFCLNTLLLDPIRHKSFMSLKPLFFDGKG